MCSKMNLLAAIHKTHTHKHTLIHELIMYKRSESLIPMKNLCNILFYGGDVLRVFTQFCNNDKKKRT